MQKKRIIFSFNAPAVLCFALLSLGALGLGVLTGGVSTRLVFSCYRSSFLNPLAYVRLVCHVLGHTSFAHYVSNMALILALGPIVEERYGSVRLLLMIAVTAVVSGLFHIFFGGDSQESLFNEMGNWPTYYPSDLSKQEIAQEMIAH